MATRAPQNEVGSRALRRILTVSTVSLLAIGVGCGGGDEGQSERAPSMLSGQTGAAQAVADGNRPPVVEALSIDPARPTPGRTVEARARVRDPDGDRPQLRYRWLDRDGRQLGEGPRFDTDGLEEGATVELVVIARDEESESAPESLEFELGGTSIEIALVVIDDSEGTQPGSLLEAVVESTHEDEGGYDVLLQWEVNDEVVGSDEELDTTAFEPGDVVVLKARLDFEDRTSRPVASRPIVLTRGAAPQIVSQPIAGIEDGLFRYQIRARSSEPNAQLTYELLSGPEGMSVESESGLVEWRPGIDQRGSFEIEVAATDQWGTGAAQSFKIDVASNAPPASAR